MEPLDPAGWSRYSYVKNDPFNLVDPSGFDGEQNRTPVLGRSPPILQVFRQVAEDDLIERFFAHLSPKNGSSGLR